MSKNNYEPVIKKESAIRDIISAMYCLDGLPFAEAMVLQLLKTLEADHTFIGKIEDSTLFVTTIAHAKDGKLDENFSFSLENTPCQAVYNGRSSVHKRGVQGLFPSNETLKVLQIQGYAGIPLFNTKRETFGVIVALYREPIKDPEFVSSIIALFANQISNELERQKGEKKIQDQAVFYQSIIDGVDESIMVIDKNYNVIITNKNAKKLKKISQTDDHVLPKCYEISHQKNSPCSKKILCPLTNVLLPKQAQIITHSYYDKNGQSITVEASCEPLYDTNGKLLGVIESSKDVTEHLKTRQELQEHKDVLHYTSHYDHLTDLPNRALFLDRLSKAIKKAKGKDKKVAVVFVDVDNFKSINDSLGIDVANETLKLIANILASNIRPIDTLARLSGDEFAIVLEEITNIQNIHDVIEKLGKMMKTPIHVHGHTLYITLSMGISRYPNDGADAQLLLKNANTAMNSAKDDGRNTHRFYAQEMTQQAFERVIMETSLREAVVKNQLIVYFQPQVNGVSEKIIGFEALVRWKHPSLGLVPPIKFIPIAEQTGIIIDIDWWVFKTSIKQIVLWRKASLTQGIMSLNLSMKLLQEGDFTLKLKNLLNKCECLPQWIELEITESHIMKNPDSTIIILKELQELGIKLSVDDFGTGYSSLAYLKRLPINKLKIDRSFIIDLPDDDEDAAIARTIISLAQNLKLNVIAEGVETMEQKEFLINNGCTDIQGYYYFKPLPAGELEIILKEKRECDSGK